MPELPPAGLSETRFGLLYYIPEIRTLLEIIDLRRKSGELWGELTVRCNLEGVRVQLDGNRMKQGNFNFSSVTTRRSWAKELAAETPAELTATLEWTNVLERVCQAVLDHERGGSIHGQEIAGKRMDRGGRPWAAWPILPDHEMATIFARGGAGKTSLIALVAFSMALGRSLIPGVRVDRPYRTAILDWETNAETAEDLWGMIAETYKVPVPKGVWYEPMDAPIERSLPKIANILDKHHADLVVVDSVMMSLLSSGDYSDPAESITRAYQALRRIGTWGLLIDHVTGGELRSNKIATKAYGSVFKTNLARHALTLHIGNRYGDTSQAYLACPKSNVGRDRWAMAGTVIRTDSELRWEFQDPDYDLYESLVGDPGSGTEMPEEELATPRQADYYLSTLAKQPYGATVVTLRGLVGASSEAMVRKTLSKLAADGLVESEPIPGARTREKRWVLSEMGRDFMDSRVREPFVPGLKPGTITLRPPTGTDARGTTTEGEDDE